MKQHKKRLLNKGILKKQNRRRNLRQLKILKFRDSPQFRKNQNSQRKKC